MVVCVIVAARMLVVSFPMHSTLLSLALCIFGSKASDMMMQEENTRQGHFARSSKYNVEMVFFMFNIAYIKTIPLFVTFFLIVCLGDLAKVMNFWLQ